MPDSDLTDLLERSVQPIEVGPAPIAEMAHRVRKVRTRRRVGAVLGLVAAASLVVAGAIVVPPLLTPPPIQVAEPSDTISLEGDWTVVRLGTDPNDSGISRDYANRVTLTFRNGEVGGDTGCNQVGGKFQQSGEGGQTLALSDLVTTAAGCANEPALLEQLSLVTSVQCQADLCQLQNAGHVTVIEIRRA